jgi:hypothetical protein
MPAHDYTGIEEIIQLEIEVTDMKFIIIAGSCGTSKTCLCSTLLESTKGRAFMVMLIWGILNPSMGSSIECIMTAYKFR